MTAAIVAILIIGYLLIATEALNHINKGAVAMFVGVVSWILYMCEGTSFVMSEHASEFFVFSNGLQPTVALVKSFIAQNIFLVYITKSCEIVLFLLATMSIIEVLNTNGCFDFVSEWIRTRNSKRLLWMLALFTYVLSANLDNLTSASMMLVIMHTLVTDTRQRMMYGSVIVIAANCGGAFTVIGDATSLALWVEGTVTPTNYSASLFLPSFIAMAVPTWLVGRKLPERLDSIPSGVRYRGDDTTLNRWQRIVMLMVGIGGLWFIPTFHRITMLSPFVGALCVLSLLWIVNELCNSRLINSDQMIMRRLPRALQYGTLQTILFFIGMSLAIGAIKETGALADLAQWCHLKIHNIYIISFVLGMLSSVIDSIALILVHISIFPITEVGPKTVDANYVGYFAEDGTFWKLLSYCSATCGSVLTIGSMAGYALMKMEKVSIGWYIRHISGKVILGFLLGLLVFFLTTTFCGL